MKNPTQKFRKNAIALEKPGISSEDLKTLTSSDIFSSIIFAETSHMFPTYQYLQKGVRDFFYLA